MNYIVCLFKKSFRGGENNEYVVINIDNIGQDDQNKIIEYELQKWGESSSGGECYGWDAYCLETITNPTKELVQHLIKRSESKIKGFELSINKEKEKMDFLLNMKNRKLPKKIWVVYEKLKNGTSLHKIKNVCRFSDDEIVDEKIVDFLISRKYIKHNFKFENDVLIYDYSVNI